MGFLVKSLNIQEKLASIAKYVGYLLLNQSISMVYEKQLSACGSSSLIEVSMA